MNFISLQYFTHDNSKVLKLQICLSGTLKKLQICTALKCGLDQSSQNKIK